MVSDRETRLREIRERIEKAKAGVGIPYSSEWDQVLIEEDVPWLLVEVLKADSCVDKCVRELIVDNRGLKAEIERLQRKLRIEQRRADELDGIGRETRKVLDRHRELASIDRDERTPEQTEELIALAIKLRGHSEEDELRAEVLRLRDELEGERNRADNFADHAAELSAEIERLRESETYAKLISQRIADENRELLERLERSKKFQSDIQDSVNKRAEARREKYRRQYVPDWQGTSAFDYPGSAVNG